jgi:hypothetical protein
MKFASMTPAALRLVPLHIPCGPFLVPWVVPFVVFRDSEFERADCKSRSSAMRFLYPRQQFTA